MNDDEDILPVPHWSAVYTQEQRERDARENIKALKGWLAVMTAASFAGWAIWFIADCAK